MDELIDKSVVYNQCLAWIHAKIKISEAAVRDAQDSANSEEKSSAGDKYETGRAMSQNERDMHARQLAVCITQKQLLDSIDITKKNSVVSIGSIVKTSSSLFFISISIGKLPDSSLFVISTDSPIGKLITGKKVGDTFVFNGRNEQIVSFY